VVHALVEGQRVHWPARRVQRCTIHGCANLEKLLLAHEPHGGSFVFARIKLVFARNGFYTRIDLYELVIITLARSSHSYWLARIGSDRSYRAHIGRIALASYTLVSARIGRIGCVGSY
jgi:hypothetical protein